MSESSGSGSVMTKILALVAAVAAVGGAVGGIYMLYEQTTLMKAQSTSMTRLIEETATQKSFVKDLETKLALQNDRLMDLEELGQLRKLAATLNDRVASRGCSARPTGSELPPCPFVASEATRRAALESLVTLDAQRRERLGEESRAPMIFDGVEVVGVSLIKADLKGARFDNANLRQADLSQASLDKATFYGANLRGANLTGAAVEGAAFQGVLYDKDTRWPEGFDPAKHNMRQIGPDADLEKADLRGADLSSAVLTGTNLKGADMRWTLIEGATCDKKTVLPRKTHTCTKDGLVAERAKKR